MKLAALIITLVFCINYSHAQQNVDSFFSKAHFLTFMQTFKDSAKVEFYADSADTHYKWADSFFLQTDESLGACLGGPLGFWPPEKNAVILITIKGKNLSLRIPLKETDTQRYLYVYQERGLLYAIRDSKIWMLE